MTEALVEPVDGIVTTRKVLSKRGVPRFDLSTAEGYAKKLWDVARQGAVSADVFARAIIGPTSKASGGAWGTRIAGLKYYGLVANPKVGDVQLSPLGLRIVNQTDAAALKVARHESVLNVQPFAQLLAQSEGAPLPDRAGIEGKFEFEYALGTADAQRAAVDFEESVKLAEFFDDNGNVRLSGDEHARVEEEGGEDLAETSSNGAGYLDGQGESSDQGEDAGKGVAGNFRGNALRRDVEDSGIVKLSINLDMSAWSPGDVLNVLSALGYGRGDE